MSDTITYTFQSDDYSETPIEVLSFEPLYYSPCSFTFETPDSDPRISPNETVYELTEYKDGAKVGELDITNGYLEAEYRSYPGQTDIYLGGASAGNFEIIGEFDAYPCFVEDTLIATANGETVVQNLKIGDVVSLANGGNAVVRWLGHRRATDTHVIRFHPNSLPTGPVRHLYVSEDHSMLVDGALVPAGLLVNGETIVQEFRPFVTLWHVELESHAILLAEGAPAESYLDTGNRHQYGNCPISYDPVEACETEACAEMVLAGSRLDEIRSLLRRPIPV